MLTVTGRRRTPATSKATKASCQGDHFQGLWCEIIIWKLYITISISRWSSIKSDGPLCSMWKILKTWCERWSHFAILRNRRGWERWRTGLSKMRFVFFKIIKQLRRKDKSLQLEGTKYVKIWAQGTWVLAEGFNSFLGNVLHSEGWPSEGRVAMLRWVNKIIEWVWCKSKMQK